MAGRRRLLRAAAGLASAVVAILSAPLFAQGLIDAAVGRTVTGVTLTIEGRPNPDDQLSGLVTVTVGEPLRREDVRATVVRLARVPGIDNVDALATLTPDGVDLTFDLVPRHPIDRVEFTGNTGLSPDTLREDLRRYYGGVPTSEPLERIEETVVRILSDQGYQNARVSGSTVRTHDPDRATLVLAVDAGELSRVNQVTVSGASPLTSREIVNRSGLRPGDPYRLRELLTRLAEIEDRLRQRGYYEARVTHRTEPAPSGSGLDVVLVVEAGPLVSIRFTGDSRPPGDVEAYVPIEQAGSADEDLVEDSRRRLERALQADGFRDARVTTTRELQDGGAALVITFDIVRGRRYRIGQVAVDPGLSLPAEVVDAALDLEPGDPYSRDAVTAAAARLIAQYLQRGFYQAVAEPQEELMDDGADAEPRVIVHPNVAEGPRALVGEIAFDLGDGAGLAADALRAAMAAQPGGPYVEAVVARDRNVLEEEYQDAGFRSATVLIGRAFRDEDTVVDLTVQATEGPRTLVADIIVVGNEQVSTDAILDEIPLRVGAPLGAAAQREAQRRLYDMGVFRSVRVEPEILPGATQASVIISVEESPATTIGYGGGVEAASRTRTAANGGLEDHLEISPRGFFEIGRRNLGGRNRSVNLFSRIALKPRNAPGDPERDGRGFGFSEYRVNVTFRERRAFDTDTDLLVGMTSEQALRTSYNFVRQGANAEFLRRLSPQVSWSGRYALEFTRLFDARIAPEDQPTIDRLFPQIRLSVLSTGALWDRRNSPADPTTGILVTGDFEVAARAIGSEVGYVKAFTQFSAFRPLTPSGRAVLAGRVQYGAARGFERTAVVRNDEGDPIVDPRGDPVEESVADLPASQRFFAGGGTTVRGFQIDRLGVPEILNADGLSLGGNGLIVLNLEVRVVAASVFGRNLSAVGFLDGGNVFERASDLDLGRIRGSYGFGVRYDSPLGPIRLDFGFKMDRRPIAGGRESGWEYHLSIGEIF